MASLYGEDQDIPLFAWLLGVSFTESDVSRPFIPHTVTNFFNLTILASPFPLFLIFLLHN